MILQEAGRNEAAWFSTHVLVSSCGRGAHGVHRDEAPVRSRPPMPLALTTEEMDLLLALAGPIDQALRPQFLQEVATELEAKRQAGEIGEGAVHRVARTIQRRFYTAPQLGESKYRA